MGNMPWYMCLPKVPSQSRLGMEPKWLSGCRQSMIYPGHLISFLVSTRTALVLLSACWLGVGQPFTHALLKRLKCDIKMIHV